MQRTDLAARDADARYAQNVRMLLTGTGDVQLDGDSMAIPLTAR